MSDHLRIGSVYWFVRVTDKTSKILTFVLLHHLPFVLSGVHVFLMLFVFVLTYTGVQHDFHIKWYSCRVTVKRRVSLVEEELIFLLEHLSSLPVFSGVRVARSLVFCVMFCWSLFVFFRLAIVLSVLLFTAFDYPFGVFKLLLIIMKMLYRRCSQVYVSWDNETGVIR